MFKNLIRLAFLILAAGITLSILYVFEFPPFQNNNSKTTSNQPTKVIDEAKQLIEENKNLPTDLQENKISRAKSYEEMMQRAELLEKNNFPALAIAQYQEAHKRDTTNLLPLENIGRIYLRSNNFSKAQISFQELVTKNPSNDNYKVLLGRSLIGERKPEQATKIFNTITSPNQISTYYQGILAAYAGNNDQAKIFLNQSIKLGQTNGSDDLNKKANNFLAAYNEFKFNLESPNIHLKVLLAKSFNQCGEYELAIPLLFQVTKEKVDYRDAWILLGYAYLQTNKYQDAIESLERAKILDNQKSETLFYLGLGYYTINDYKKAEENLTLAKQYGFQPVILVDQKLAEVYLLLQNYSKSAAAYEQLLSLNSEDINYYIRPIWIYLEKTKEPGKALLLAEKANTLHPNQAMSHNLLGWTLIYNNQFEKAEKELKTAMAIDPSLDATYLNFGILFEKQNQNDKAVVFYKKAHQLGQGNSIADSAADHYNKLIAKTNNPSLKANLLSQ